jgi:hypothetical protein
MLGDGYLCYSEDARYPLWQPEFDWDFGRPLGRYFVRTYGSDSLYVRMFAEGMVEVNPNESPVHGVPGRDSRFTFWNPAVDLPDPVEAAGAAASGFLAVRPNPFSSKIELPIRLSEPARVLLEICDTRGRRISTLVDAALGAGTHVALWDGRDGGGRVAPAGVYHGRLRIAGRTEVIKVVLAK